MEKGHTNNPNGRPKGSPNKITSELKEWLKELLEGNRDQIKADLQAIEPEERVRLLFSLLPYIIPKQQAVSAKMETEIPIILIDDGLDGVLADDDPGT